MHLIRFTLLACAVTFSAAASAETPKKTGPSASASSSPKKTNPSPTKKTGDTSDGSKKNAKAPETK